MFTSRDFEGVWWAARAFALFVLVLVFGLGVGLAAIVCAVRAEAQTLPHSGSAHLVENNDQNYVATNEIGDRLDDAINNALTIATGDADVSLTNAQHFGSALIELTGTLTADRNLTLASTCPGGGGSNPCEKRLAVWNNTSGGFDIIVKYATGATVTVSPGLVQLVHADGTDVVRVDGTDIAQLTTEGGVQGSADKFVMWDDSAKALRAVLGENLPGGAGGGGGFANFRGAMVERVTTENLASEVPEYINWVTELLDTDNFWAASPNPSRFTIPAGVTKVLVGGTGLFNGSGDRIRLAVHKNGAALADCKLHSLGQGAGSDGVPWPTCLIRVGGGDYLEFEVIHSGTGTPTFENGTVWLQVVDPVPVSRVSDNQLVNGDFQVCQRACSFSGPADDAYTLDRFVNLVEGAGGADHAQETSVVPGAPGATTALKLTAQTANDKFGIVQILPADRSARLRGGKASLSWQMRTTTGTVVANVRAGVICWSGTADAVTSDVVSTWNAAATNPTLATSWAFSNTPGDVAVTVDAYGLAEVEDVTVGAGCNNVGVFLWVDEDSAVGDLLYLTDIQLEPSSLASGYQRQDFETVLAEAERHYRKSFPYGTAVAQNAGTTGAVTYRVDTAGVSNDGAQVQFGRRMFGSPNIVFYNPSAANALWRNTTDAGDSGAATADNGSESGFFARNAQVATDGAGEETIIHWSAEAEL